MPVTHVSTKLLQHEKHKTAETHKMNIFLQAKRCILIFTNYWMSTIIGEYWREFNVRKSKITWNGGHTYLSSPPVQINHLEASSSNECILGGWTAAVETFCIVLMSIAVTEEPAAT